MLNGVRIYASDTIWRQILADLNATVLDAPLVAELNFDELNISAPLTPIELKTAIVDAQDSGHIISRILGAPHRLPRLQTNILVLLAKTGGMSIADLKVALGYAPDATTHTVDTAIYQLRRTFGHDLIKNENGVYKIGRV